MTRHRRRWLSAGEVADYWRVHVETVYRAVRRGELPVRRFPTGRILIDKAVAEEFAAPTPADIRQQMTAYDHKRQQV